MSITVAPGRGQIGEPALADDVETMAVLQLVLLDEEADLADQPVTCMMWVNSPSILPGSGSADELEASPTS
jgi:hypothetical protein